MQRRLREVALGDRQRGAIPGGVNFIRFGQVPVQEGDAVLQVCAGFDQVKFHLRFEGIPFRALRYKLEKLGID